MKRKILSIPPVYFCVGLVGITLVRLLVPSLNRIEFPFTLAGLAFVGAGVYWNGRAIRSLTRHATPVTFAPSTCFIGDGVYRRSRNPMYLGLVLLLIGCSIISGNLLSFLSPLFLFGVLNWMFIPYEEEKMEKTFGPEYLGYKQKVRRWL